MISRELKNFIFRIFIAVLILSIGAWLVFEYIIPHLYLPVFPLMVVVFSVLTVISFGFQNNLARKDMGKFARSSMLISMGRLMVYSAFAFVYLANNKENVVVFIICLALLYLIFTILETASLTRVARR